MDKTEKSAFRNSWIAEKLDRVNLTMPKGKKEQIKETRSDERIAFYN